MSIYYGMQAIGILKELIINRDMKVQREIFLDFFDFR